MNNESIRNASIQAIRRLRTEKSEAVSFRAAAETARKAAEDARDELRNQLAEKIAALTESNTVADKLRRLADMTLWAELDSGKSIAVGTTVRYFGRIYECIVAHTKALTRLPTNNTCWAEVINE